MGKGRLGRHAEAKAQHNESSVVSPPTVLEGASPTPAFTSLGLDGDLSEVPKQSGSDGRGSLQVFRSRPRFDGVGTLSALVSEMDSISLTDNPPNRDEVLRAMLWTFAQANVNQFVQLVVLASEFHPQELRRAFEIALGSDSLVESNRRAIQLSAQAMAKADDAARRALAVRDEVNDAVNKLDQQIGALFRRLESANTAIDQLAKKVSSSLPGGKTP